MELAGTKIALYSRITRAIGTDARRSEVFLFATCAMPPVSAIPMIRAAFCLPLMVWKWARPVVPPAPGLKSVVVEVNKPSAISVLEIASVVAE